MNELSFTSNPSDFTKLREALSFWKKRLTELEKIEAEDPYRYVEVSGIVEKPAAWSLQQVRIQTGRVRDYVKALEAEIVIKTSMSRISSSFMAIGWQLSQFNPDGTVCTVFDPNRSIYNIVYLRFSDFCEQRFGIKRSTAYALRNVYKAFGCGQEGKVLPAYKDYSYSQLVEMLPLSSEERKKVKPEMSIKDIRALKQSEKATVVKATELKPTPAPQEQLTVEEAPQKEQANGVLLLKNDKEREAWIADYEKHCYLWVDVPSLYLKVYRYDFKNGDYFLVVRAGKKTSVYGLSDYGQKHYQVVKKGEAFNIFSLNHLDHRIIDYLKKHRDEI